MTDDTPTKEVVTLEIHNSTLGTPDTKKESK